MPREPPPEGVHAAQGPAHGDPPGCAGRPLFCDTALARRIEQAEARLIAAASHAARRRAGTAGFVIPVAGGVASFAGHGSPFNKVAGPGFGGVPGAAALEEIERAFAARGAAVQIELAHLADPAIGALLTERGYRLTSFENVLGLALQGESERVTPPGIEVRASGDEEFGAWVDVVASTCSTPAPSWSSTLSQLPEPLITAWRTGFQAPPPTGASAGWWSCGRPERGGGSQDLQNPVARRGPLPAWQPNGANARTWSCSARSGRRTCRGTACRWRTSRRRAR